MLLGAYVLEFGASLHKVMTKGFEVSGKQAEPSEVIDPRRVRLEKLLAEREKLTSEIIALRQEFERETPLYRGNALTDLRADETSVQYQPYAPRQGGVNWPFVEELLGRSVDEKWKKGS
ncbi:hypothetical protein HYT45_01460 [Candidatus Uhrbacteria bacterium]|nr:hypothetical protein [Candidatus Uhrbacteria bacterium]